MNSLLLKWLYSWRTSTPAPRKLRRFLPGTAEGLEFRVMLDGNVTAIVADGNLNIEGDAAANSVEVTLQDGDVVVKGLDGTTVNGSADPFVAFSATSQITGDTSIYLAGGNDLVAFSNGIEVGGSVSIIDLRGTNQIGIHNSTISGNVFILTGRSADEVVLSRSTISGMARINTLQGADTVSLFEMTIGGNSFIRTGKHKDAVVIEDSQFDGNLFLNTGRDQDDVVIMGSTISGNLFGMTGSGDDLLLFDGSTVTGRTTLLMLRGNDTVLTQNTNTFTGRFWAGGILGNSDTFEASTETTFSGGNRSVRFEGDTVDATTLDERLNGDPDGAVTRSDAARTTFGDLLVGDFDLTADLAADANVVDSNGIPLTKDDTLTVEGTTLANGTVNVDANGDGLFDDGTAVADSDGNYAVDVTLGDGAQSLMYEVTDATGRKTVMTAETSVYKAIGTVVEYASSMGNFDVELLDEDAPITVANYLSYLNDYTNSIVHRSPGNDPGNLFVVQGGGYTVENGVVSEIATPSTGIENEFNADNSNIAGTLSMALQPGNPMSGTSGWFFNTVDNSNLDANLHTVFGRIIGDALPIITAIDELPTYTITTAAGTFTDIPLVNYSPTTDLTGTFTVAAGEMTVTGTGTAFTSELEVDQQIQLGDQLVTIAAIASDTELTLTAVHVNGATDVTVTVDNEPTDDNFVIFTSITEILV